MRPCVRASVCACVRACVRMYACVRVDTARNRITEQVYAYHGSPARRKPLRTCVHAYTCAYIICDAGHDVTSHYMHTEYRIYATTVASAGARLELYRTPGHSTVHSTM